MEFQGVFIVASVLSCLVLSRTMVAVDPSSPKDDVRIKNKHETVLPTLKLVVSTTGVSNKMIKVNSS